MTAPKLLAITFAGDGLAPSIDAFARQLAEDPAYWTAATSEFGVGSLTMLPPRHVSDTPPSTLDDSDVQSWLSSEIAESYLPTPDRNTLFAVFYPPGTTITRHGRTSCRHFAGYHSDVMLEGGSLVTYAVIARCGGRLAEDAASPLTGVASHEIVEAASDPLPVDDPAWAELDPNHLGWELLGGGEIADACVTQPGSLYRPSGWSFLVQRVWSNDAAAASHDPCGPARVTPYFNSAVVATDRIEVGSRTLGHFATDGVHVPIGESRVVDLALFSDAPTDSAWTVSAVDATSSLFGGPVTLSFSFDRNQGENGDHLHLTVRALAKSPLGASPFLVVSTLGAVKTAWVGIVGN